MSTTPTVSPFGELSASLNTSKGSFRLNAKYAFLTYPRCSASPQDVLDRTRKLTGYHSSIVARELHQDGTPHIHILVAFQNKCDFKSFTRLDELGGLHGNYASVRQLLACYNYVRKGNDFLDDNFPVQSKSSNKRSRDEKELDIYAPIATLGSERAVIDHLLDKAPAEYFKFGHNILNNYRRHAGTEPPNYLSPYPIDSFKPTRVMLDWLDEYGYPPNLDRRKALILVGPTCLGKTAWARSLDPCHIFMRSAFNIDKWHEQAKYIVIDDIDWKFIPNKKQLILAMGECEFTDKYRPKKTIINHKPTIILLNSLNIEEEQEYWEENTVIVYLDNKLY